MKNYFKKLGADIRRESGMHLMILPALIVVILLSYLPMYGVTIAFKNFDVFKGVIKSPWASNGGFEHFVDFFKSPQAYTVIRNTVWISFLKLTLTLFPPVILAILLNEVTNLRYKKTVQTLSYLPHFISWAVAGGIFYNLLSPSGGPVNTLLINMGVIDSSIDFISTGKFYIPLIILTHIWKDIGWSSIIYLGVITTIDPALYEALEIDGGNRLQKIRYITWPFLKGTFAILFIMACGRIMSGAGDTFDQAYVFGTPSNRNVSDILDIFIMRVGLENARYSYATAVNLFKSAINVILLITANKVSRKLTEKSLF